MQKKIRACRLVTGEYLIAFVAPMNPTGGLQVYEFEDPLLFDVMSGEAPGQHRVGFQSLVPLAPPGVTIKIGEKDVMFWIEEPNEEIVQRYNEAISLIVKATSGPIN